MFENILQNRIRFITYFCVFIIFIYSYSTYEEPQDVKEKKLLSCINSFSTESNAFTSNPQKIFILGHAYGSQETKEIGLSRKVLNLFDSFSDKNHTLVLTGDIVLENNLDALNKVKNDIEEHFHYYLIAAGNHDIGYSGYQTDNLQSNDNFREVFSKDLFIQEYESFSLIASNFSTFNWEPTIENQKAINDYLLNTKIKNIFLFSHQLFWLEEVNNEIRPNGKNMLTTELKSDSLYWLEGLNKNIIVISGDYGIYGEPPYCRKIGNKLFIANGIHEFAEDKYIILNFIDDRFFLSVENIK